jgi:small-conductance mechanosensitive channel
VAVIALLSKTPDWFEDTFLGIEVEQFIGIGVLILVATLAHFVLMRIITVLVRHRFTGADLTFWQTERRRLNRALLLLIIGITVLLGFPTPNFDADVANVVTTIARLIAAVLFVTVVGILFVLQNLDVNVSSLIAGLGLGGLAIALAAQDTVRNLLGGVTIFADKPFEVGDWVVVDGIEGTVETVGFRSTKVRTFYNSLVSVPNGNLMDAGIDNMGQRRWRRYKTTLGIGYHTKPDQMQAFVEGLRAIIRANPGMRQDYYMVEFHGFGSISLDVLVYCFIDAPDWNEELRTRHVFNLDIMRLAERLHVDFAFPTQTVHVAEMPGQPPSLPDIPDREQLREIVDSFGPGGRSGQRVDQPISAGHESVLESPYAQADEG